MTNSNTTFVKVKWNKYMENKNGNYIQIQHLLKLNVFKENMCYIQFNSNTTFVKVK